MNTATDMIVAHLPRAWERVSSRPGPDLIVFRSRFDRLKHPRSGKELDRLVLESTDWVNVVALTEEGRVVVVRQYRFGTEVVTRRMRLAGAARAAVAVAAALLGERRKDEINSERKREGTGAAFIFIWEAL